MERSRRGADAFAFVTREYNFGLTAPLKNAIDSLHGEWRHKPVGLVGLVGYGGVAAGTRAVQRLEQVVATLGTVPLLAAVSIPFVAERIGEDGEVHPDEVMDRAARDMRDELVRREVASRPLRGPA